MVLHGRLSQLVQQRHPRWSVGHPNQLSTCTDYFFVQATIICSSASTFKALLKTYLPKLWNTSQRSTPQQVQRYDRSNNRQVSMKPYGASSNKSQGHRKYGVTDLTIIGNESEEAIVSTEESQSDTSK